MTSGDLWPSLLLDCWNMRTSEAPCLSHAVRYSSCSFAAPSRCEGAASPCDVRRDLTFLGLYKCRFVCHAHFTRVGRVVDGKQVVPGRGTRFDDGSTALLRTGQDRRLQIATTVHLLRHKRIAGGSGGVAGTPEWTVILAEVGGCDGGRVRPSAEGGGPGSSWPR